jgi:hypothetical protein
MLQIGEKAETLKSAGATKGSTKVSTKVLEGVANMRTDVPCATCYKLGYIVAKLHGYNGAGGGKAENWKLKAETGWGRQRLRQGFDKGPGGGMRQGCSIEGAAMLKSCRANRDKVDSSRRSGVFGEIWPVQIVPPVQIVDASGISGGTLIADAPVARADAQASGVFATPSVVHFGVVLFLSAIVSAPWGSLTPVAVLWGLLGLFGIAYSFIVARRLRTQTPYNPVCEDWLFHALLPLVAYLALAASPCGTGFHPRPALFTVAAAALLLLFVGIHNAWDAVTYHVFVRKRAQSEPDQATKPEE